MNVGPTPPHETAARAGPGGGRLLRRLLLGLLALALGLPLAAWLAWHALVLPNLDRWRAPLQAHLSSEVGAPVRIAALEAHAGRWRPRLVLRDIDLLDAEDRVALHLQRVVATLSLRSLLAFAPRLAALELDAATLDLRRDASGRWWLAGVDIGDPLVAGPAANPALQAMLRLPSLSLQRGTLRFTDEWRGTPPLQLSDVELQLARGWRGHTLALAATPPAGWGQRFTLNAQLTQPLLAGADAVRPWNGKVELTLPNIDVGVVARALQLPFELHGGSGRLRAALTLQDGLPVQASADLALQALGARLGSGLPALSVTALQLRAVAERKAGQSTLALQDLAFVTASGQAWPASRLQLAWRGAAGGELRADRIELATLAELAAGLPLPADWRQTLASLQPRGRLAPLDLAWTGNMAAPASWRLQAEASALQLQAAAADPAGTPGRPGFGPASVTLDASDSGGQARVALRAGRLVLPGVWADPVLPLDSLDARLSWQVDRSGGRAQAAAITVKLDPLQFSNADTSGRFSASWRSGPDAAARWPGLLSLDGTLGEVELSRLARYLPLALPSETRRQLAQALRQGHASGASVRLRGALADFPYGRGQGSGEFTLGAALRGVELALAAPDWPALSGGSAQLLIDRDTLQLRNASATWAGLAFSGITAEVAPLGASGQLTLRAGTRAPLATMLAALRATPVNGWTGGALAQAQASGDADLQLSLKLPLADPAQASVDGSLQLAGNDLRLAPAAPLLADTRGRVEFTQQRLALRGASARVLGGELAFEGGAEAGQALRFSGRGTLAVDALRRAPEFAALAGNAWPVSAWPVSGQVAYQLQLGFAGGRPQVDLRSTLVGLAIELPAPLGKSAAAPLDLHLQAGPAPDATAAQHTLLQLALGSALRARFVRDDSGARPRVLRGAIQLDDSAAAAPPAMPASGVAARIALAQLDSAAWEAALARLAGVGAPTATAARDGSSGSDEAARAGYLPDTVSLRIARLQLGALDIAPAEAEARRVALPGDAGAWQISRFRLATPTATLSGSGDWRQEPGSRSAPRRTAIDFELALADSGDLLEQLGLGRVLRGGKGRIGGTLAWPGSPLAPLPAQLRGQLQVALDSGQFLKASPGAARLLSVLSLQALPRRLLLDFRDVFAEGFAFDHVDGDVHFERGVASTRNLRMHGPAAMVLLEGSADLARETQDLRALVVPQFDAGGASLAYALVNPAVGLGSFVAQWLLQRPLTAAGTRAFSITGPWAEPKVEPVDPAALPPAASGVR